LNVALVVPDQEIWVGTASMVIAKTLEGDIGVLTGHPPVLGILAEGSVVRILDPDDDSASELRAAVSDGFLAIADDRVSILARQAELGREVDTASVRAELDAAGAAGTQGTGGEEPAEARYARALLRAAGEQA
jgi:F-type H+-transporting ATPase subunit epsilon